MTDEVRIPLIYDVELRKPGCVLIQAIGGGDSDILNRYFTNEDWLIAPTPGMRRVHATEEEWKKEAAFIHKKGARNGRKVRT